MAAPAVVDIAQVLERQKFRRFHLRLGLCLLLAMLLEGYDLQSLGYSAPLIVKAWGIRPAALGPVFGVALFGLMFGAIIGGQLGDRLGRRVAIVLGAGFLGICCLATAAAQNVDQLFYIRFFAGAGIGAVMPNAVALGTEYAPRRLQATAVMCLFIGNTLGAMGGALVVAYLVPGHGWPVVFLVGGVGPLLVAGAAALFLPESLQFAASRPRQRAAAVAILARISPDSVVAPDTVLLVREAKLPGLELKHLLSRVRAPATLMLWLAFLFNLMSLHFLLNWMPTVLQSAAMPGSQAAFATMVFQLGGMAGAIVLSRLLDRVGILPIAAVFVAGTICVAMIGSSGGAKPLLLGMMFFAGFAVIGGQTNLNAISGKIYPTGIRANGVGWANAMGRFGSILGPVVGGILVGMDLPLNRLFLAAAAPVLLAGLSCYGLSVMLARRDAAAEPAH